MYDKVREVGEEVLGGGGLGGLLRVSNPNFWGPELVFIIDHFRCIKIQLGNGA